MSPKPGLTFLLSVPFFLLLLLNPACCASAALGVEAHLGFLLQLESMLMFHSKYLNIQRMLHSLVKRAHGAVDRVVCVGHSLGGALATLGESWEEAAASSRQGVRDGREGCIARVCALSSDHTLPRKGA